MTDMEPTKRAGNYLRKLRKDQGLTLGQVAEGIRRLGFDGYTLQQVRRLELGEVQNPKMLDIEALSQFYRLDPKELAALYDLRDDPTMPGLDIADQALVFRVIRVLRGLPSDQVPGKVFRGTLQTFVGQAMADLG